MADNREFEFEGAATPSEAADALNRIAEGIRARSLSLSMGDEEITVYPEGDLAMEIEASEKKGKAKIEIAIAWKRAKGDDDDDDYAERGSRWQRTVSSSPGSRRRRRLRSPSRRSPSGSSGVRSASNPAIARSTCPPPATSSSS